MSALRSSLPVYEPVSRPRAMTRCECAGIAFSEVAYRMEAHGQTFGEVRRATGCAGNCTACKPDLAAYLEARGLKITP